VCKHAEDNGAVGTYLVEAYLARLRASELAQAASRAQAAAEELSRQGDSVRYLRTIFLPQEETCFHVYEAASADDVCEACRRAGIACERVLDAVDITPAREKTNQKEKR
jgi:hypothetical protein